MAVSSERSNERSTSEAHTLFKLRAEEEVFLVCPRTHQLLTDASGLLGTLQSDSRFSEGSCPGTIGIATGVCRRPSDIAFELARARAELSAHLQGDAVLLASGCHPAARPQHGWAQLRVRVSAGRPERAAAILGPLRGFVPEVVTLSGNSPFAGGGDTGRATAHAGGPAQLLRLHRAPDAQPGVLEFRLDAQTTVEHAAGVVALCQALVIDVALRHSAGRPASTHATERIALNLTEAQQHGLDATLADLETGALASGRGRVSRLLMQLYESSAADGFVGELDLTWALLTETGAMRQRRHVERQGLAMLPKLLAGETERSARRTFLGAAD